MPAEERRKRGGWLPLGIQGSAMGARDASRLHLEPDLKIDPDRDPERINPPEKKTRFDA